MNFFVQHHFYGKFLTRLNVVVVQSSTVIDRGKHVVHTFLKVNCAFCLNQCFVVATLEIRFFGVLVEADFIVQTVFAFADVPHRVVGQHRVFVHVRIVGIPHFEEPIVAAIRPPRCSKVILCAFVFDAEGHFARRNPNEIEVVVNFVNQFLARLKGLVFNLRTSVHVHDWCRNY